MKLDYIAPLNTKLHQYTGFGTQEEFVSTLANEGYKFLPVIFHTKKTIVHFALKNDIFYVAFKTGNAFRLWTVGSKNRSLKENETQDMFLRKVLNEVLIEEYRNYLNKVAILGKDDSYLYLSFESKIV